MFARKSTRERAAYGQPVKQPEEYRRVEWLNVAITHVLLVFMMGCVGLVIAQVLRRLAPDWPYTALPWLCMLIAVEAMVSWYITQRKSDLEVSEATSLLIEWIVLLIGIRLFLSLQGGLEGLLSEIPLWQREFMSTFLEFKYLAFVFLAAAVWFMSRTFTGDLAETRGDELLMNTEALGGFSSDRGAIRRRMATVIFAVGFFLVALTALLFIDARYVSRVLYVSRAGLLAVIFYFLFGLGLLSQVQFSVLRAAWVWEKITYDPGMLKRWTAYSLVFLLIVSLVAFMLPTGYSMGLLATLNYLLQLLIAVIYGIFFILSIPIFWLLSLFRREESAVVEESLPPPVMPRLPEQPQQAAPVPWLEFLKSLLFWVVFLSLVGYAVYQYVRQNQALMEKLRKMRLFNWLAGTWKWFVGVLRGWNEGIGSAVQAGIQRLRARRETAAANLSRRFVNLKRLTPRQRVMFFYLAMVRRGTEQGLPRQPYQTPAEYARLLRTNLPELDEDLEEITGDFMEARYTRHEIESDRVTRMKQAWDRIKRALRDWNKR